MDIELDDEIFNLLVELMVMSSVSIYQYQTGLDSFFDLSYSSQIRRIGNGEGLCILRDQIGVDADLSFSAGDIWNRTSGYILTNSTSSIEWMDDSLTEKGSILCNKVNRVINQCGDECGDQLYVVEIQMTNAQRLKLKNSIELAGEIADL